MTFGEEIKYVRNVLFLTQAEMAQLMSVTEQTIRRWESNKSEPRKSAKRQLNDICHRKKIKIDKENKNDISNR